MQWCLQEKIGFPVLVGKNARMVCMHAIEDGLMPGDAGTSGAIRELISHARSRGDLYDSETTTVRLCVLYCMRGGFLLR